MNASMLPFLAFVASLALLVRGDEPTPFYERLSTKVGTLAAAADFDKEEKSHIVQTAYGDYGGTGAEVLKKWAVSHQAAASAPVDASHAFDEVADYATHLRDASKARLRAAAQAHAMMHGAAMAPSTELAEAHSTTQGSTAGDLGRDLLKQWSSVHAQAAPAPVVAKPPPVRAAVEKVIPARPVVAKMAASKPAHSKAFMRAHEKMHAFDAAGAADELIHASIHEADVSIKTEAASHTGVVASGGDLLANWAKVKELTKAAASLKEAAHEKLQAPSMHKSSEASAISEDLQSLRSTMEGKQGIEEDERSLKKMVKDMTSGSGLSLSHKAELHAAMHSIESDVPEALPVSEVHPVSESVKATGADTLEKWSQDKIRAQAVKEEVEAMMHPEPAPRPVPVVAPVAAAPVEKVAAPDNAAKRHAAAVHAAMHDIIEDAGDAAVSTSDSQATKEAGADDLEKWSKAHQPKEVKSFMKREVLLSPSVVPSLPTQVETVSQKVEASDVEKMQSSVSKWHGSSMHDAMRNIGSDVPEVDASDSSASASKASVGADALDQWSKAHKEVQSAKLVSPKPKASLTGFMHKIFEEHLHDPDPVFAAPQAVVAVSSDVHVSAQQLHLAALHDAMRKVGSDVAEVDTASTQAEVVETSKATGADVLDQWSNAHRKAEKPVFSMKDMQDVYAEQAATSPLVASAYKDAPTSSVSNAVEDLRTSAEDLHRAKVHDAMRQIVSDVPDVDVAGSQPQVVAAAAGASVLDQWSNAHKKAETPRFTMPKLYLEQPPLRLPSAPAAPAEKEPVTLRESAKELHASAFHDAMRKVGNDAPDVDTVSSQPDVSADSLKAAGADALDQWSKAHQKVEKAEFAMPVVQPEAAVPHVEEVMQAAFKPVEEVVVQETARQVAHAQMQSVGSDVAASQDVISNPAAVEDSGSGLMDKWSDAHPTEQPKHKSFLVDMYPPTVAPVEDMLAMAMKRGFGKKAEMSLAAHKSKAAKLHEAMQSMDDNSEADAKSSASKLSAQAAASTGADILSQWSHAHK